MSKAAELIETVIGETTVYMKNDRDIVFSVDNRDAERMLIKAGIPFAHRKQYYAHSPADIKSSAPTPSTLARIGKRVTPKREPRYDPAKERAREQRVKDAAEKKFWREVKKEARSWRGAASDMIGNRPGEDPDSLMQSAASEYATFFMDRPDIRKYVSMMDVYSREGLRDAVADEFYEEMLKGAKL